MAVQRDVILWKSQTGASASQIYFILEWHSNIFWTVFPSIIRSLRLYIQHQIYVKQILLTAC